MNGTTSRGVFKSIAKAQAADLRPGIVIWISGGRSYDIKSTTVNADFILNNGNGAFIRVSETIAASSEIEWDFEYVANDSLKLRSGYGNSSNEIDFSRASDTESTNKSSVVITLASDKESITTGGIECYASYTNKLNYSKDLSNAAWSKTNAIISLGAEGYVFSDGSNSGEHFIRQVTPQAHGSGLSCKVRVKDIGGSLSVRLRLADSTGFIGSTYFNFATESFYSTSSDLYVMSEKLEDGSFYLNVKSNNSTSTSPQLAIYSVLEGTTDSVYTGVDGSFYIINTQCADSATYLPMKTSVTVPMSRSSEVISTPVMGNMPMAGRGFTIEVDTSIPQDGSRCVFNIDTDDPSVLFILRRVTSGGISLQFDNSDGSDSGIIVQDIDDSKHRFTSVYDGSNLSLYIDSVIGATKSDINSKSYDINGDIHIGCRNGTSEFLNSEIKSFRIKHSALTVDQIAARGGYNS